MCTTCAKKVARTTRQGSHGKGSWEGWDDDPYLYDVFYYGDYGLYNHGYWAEAGDGHDFTEADGDGLGDGAGSDWEHDMGAS